jgi:hypothetical protein
VVGGREQAHARLPHAGRRNEVVRLLSVIFRSRRARGAAPRRPRGSS